ncbi:DUF2786 domain-containing protein [Pseudonocardia sp.]|uniref:DUF2786 domain-containing protein n=1 Tax=Pseudonocardia sp. TaxID=60912 RepID=UPI00260FEFC1|nr:DUF2786 domain-containing protein [Pseudonocardia sp.]
MGTDKLDTIRKLLAKAEGAATTEEAEAYTAKAVDLMARHGVDEALLGAADPARDPIGAVRVALDDPYSAAKARLLGWVASALGCRCVLHEARGGRVGTVTVFGHASDRERVEVLYTSLLLQATAQVVGLRPPRTGESVAAYRRSWLHGFAVEVHRRLTAAEQAAADAARAAPPGTGGPSVALVLADRRERVDRAYAAAFPALGRARRSVLSGSGFGAGARAGARADLGHTAVGRSRSRALGA